VAIGVGQQRQETCPLDGGGELALITSLGPGDAAGNDLAGLGDIGLERVQILVSICFTPSAVKRQNLRRRKKRAM
jgi:hypothetical protein